MDFGMYSSIAVCDAVCGTSTELDRESPDSLNRHI